MIQGIPLQGNHNILLMAGPCSGAIFYGIVRDDGIYLKGGDKHTYFKDLPALYDTDTHFDIRDGSSFDTKNVIPFPDDTYWVVFGVYNSQGLYLDFGKAALLQPSWNAMQYAFAQKVLEVAPRVQTLHQR